MIHKKPHVANSMYSEYSQCCCEVLPLHQRRLYTKTDALKWLSLGHSAGLFKYFSLGRIFSTTSSFALITTHRKGLLPLQLRLETKAQRLKRSLFVCFLKGFGLWSACFPQLLKLSIEESYDKIPSQIWVYTSAKKHEESSLTSQANTEPFFLLETSSQSGS